MNFVCIDATPGVQTPVKAISCSVLSSVLCNARTGATDSYSQSTPDTGHSFPRIGVQRLDATSRVISNTHQDAETCDILFQTPQRITDVDLTILAEPDNVPISIPGGENLIVHIRVWTLAESR